MFAQLKYIHIFDMQNYRGATHNFFIGFNLYRLPLFRRAERLHRSHGGFATPLQGLFMLKLTLNKLSCKTQC